MLPIVYFVRHGQTDWNAEARFQGQRDIDINVRGRGQAQSNGRRLKQILGDAAGFDFVASPMRRTRETMELLRTQMGLPAQDYAIEPRLMELNFGLWEGYTIEEIEARIPGSAAERDRDKWGYLPPGDKAESYETLAVRVAPWLESVSRPTVCVTHGGVIRAIFLLTGQAERAVAESMDVPQDKILRLLDGRLAWL